MSFTGFVSYLSLVNNMASKQSTCLSGWFFLSFFFNGPWQGFLTGQDIMSTTIWESYNKLYQKNLDCFKRSKRNTKGLIATVFVVVDLSIFPSTLKDFVIFPLFDLGKYFISLSNCICPTVKQNFWVRFVFCWFATS